MLLWQFFSLSALWGGGRIPLGTESEIWSLDLGSSEFCHFPLQDLGEGAEPCEALSPNIEGEQVQHYLSR